MLEYLAIITHANFKVYLEVDPNYHEGSSLNRFVWEEVGEGGGEGGGSWGNQIDVGPACYRCKIY